MTRPSQHPSEASGCRRVRSQQIHRRIMMNRVFVILGSVIVGLAGAMGALAGTPAEGGITAGDPVVGKRLAERCLSCHILEPEGRKRWGPSLFGIVDKPVGSVPDYRYGRYLRDQHASGATWTEDSLRVWLTDSKEVARAAGGRTKMPGQDLGPRQVEDLISYLRTLK